VAALLLLCLGGSAWAASDYNPALDLWPLLRVWTSDDGSTRNVEALGPVLEWRRTADERAFYLRPLYNRRNDRQSAVTESEWLYPIGFGTRRPDLKRRVMFPLSLSEKETLSDGTQKTRRIILPFFYRRTGAGKDSLLVFPFGGVLRDFFGREKAVVVLWPLFVYQRSALAQSWSVLHPIVSRVKWADGGRGFKVWPIFGINRRPDKMIKIFALWPIFHYQRMKLDQGLIKRTWVFPFYGHIASPGGWEWAVLWPFISHRVDRNARQEDWWFPWPFLGRRTGTQVSGRTFWPLFSTERRPGRRKAGFLWPLGWYNRTATMGERTSSLRIIPLMFNQHEETDAGKSGAWQLWPLIKYRHAADGQAEAEFPSILPLRYFAAWERNFAPFFRIFKYHRSKQGLQSWRLLGRLVRVDKGPDVRYVEVIPLFKVHSQRTGDGAKRWSILKGFIGCESTGGRRRWQLLYFIRLGKRPDDEAMETVAE